MSTKAKPILYSSQATPFRLFEVILNTKVGEKTFIFDYSGFQWDLLNGTVTLSEPERTECLNVIKRGLSSSTSLIMKDLDFMQGLVAKLIQASHVMVEGRRHLGPLLDAFLEPEQPLSGRRRSRLRCDLIWWHDTLRCKGNVTPIVEACGNPVQIEIYTDASTEGGCATVIDGKSKSWRWNDGVNVGIPHASWAEAMAIELAVRDLVSRPELKGATFQILCDPEEVIQRWMVGGSKNVRLNKVIASIARVLVEHNCWITLEKVCSKDNPADKPSRSGMSTHGGSLDAFLHSDTREYLM